MTSTLGEDPSNPPTLIDMITWKPLGELEDGSFRLLLDVVVKPMDPTGVRTQSMQLVDFHDGPGLLTNQEAQTVAAALVHRLRTGEWLNPETEMKLKTAGFISHPDSGGDITPLDLQRENDEEA
jgi:hypothetical protein